MIGLAVMAMKLAEQRTERVLFNRFSGTGNVVPRERLDIFGPWPASIEYYRIIDRISRGEKP